MNNKIGYKQKMLILLVVTTIMTIISFMIRKPYEGEGFSMSDATYHVLLTMQAYDETPASVHHFLPIQTFGADYNKYIQNGPSLLQDELGNSYYVSFSPIGFYAPYFFCKIFHLDLNIQSLYIFNGVLMLLSATLIGLIINILLKNEYIACIMGLTYMFLPEVLYTQGIVYWNHSLSQIFLLVQMLLFIIIFIENKDNKFYNILFFVSSFLYPYTEWSGFISNVGIALGILILNSCITYSQDGEKRVSIAIKAFKYVSILATLTIGALLYYIWRFHSIASVNEIISALTSRAEARDKASYLSLFEGYKLSYWTLLIMITISLLVAFTLKKSRKILMNYIKQKNTIICFIIFLFPVVENFIMTEHAICYTFDRLKLSLILIYIYAIAIYSLKEYSSHIAFGLTTVMSGVVVVLGLYTYGNDKIVNLEENNSTLIMKDYLEKNYLESGESILVKEGWRAWGYLQTLYHRNIYCTQLYSDAELFDEAKKGGEHYIVYLEPTSGYWDTECYTQAKVININTLEFEQLQVSEGKVDVSQINEIQAANFTDDNWTNGISNSKTEEILFSNTVFNLSKIKDSVKILCNSEEYSITGWDNDDLWIHVYVDKDATNCSYPNALQIY